MPRTRRFLRRFTSIAALVVLVAVVLAAAAGPANRWLAAAASDLGNAGGYRTAVLGDDRGGQP